MNKPTRNEIMNSFMTLAKTFPERRSEFEGEAFKFTREGFDLSVLGLKTRTANVLRGHGYHSTLALTHMTGRELNQLIFLEGIWTKSLEEIKSAVEAFLS